MRAITIHTASKGDTTMTRTIVFKASKFEDHDDSLQAATEHVCRDLGVEEWQVDAQWGCDGAVDRGGRVREEIIVTVDDVEMMMMSDTHATEESLYNHARSVIGSAQGNVELSSLREVVAGAWRDGLRTCDDVLAIWREAEEDFAAESTR